MCSIGKERNQAIGTCEGSKVINRGVVKRYIHEVSSGQSSLKKPHTGVSTGGTFPSEPQNISLMAWTRWKEDISLAKYLANQNNDN